MAKAISNALLGHYAGGSTTISRQARIQRKDGFVLLGTTCAHNLLINGELYLSKYGTTPSTISQEASAAVANSEIDGFLSDLVTEADLKAGLWDSALVSVFEVNYRDLTMGILTLQTGAIGNVTAGRSAFKADIRGVSQSLQNTVGRYYTQTCSAVLGDVRCKVSLTGFTVTGALTSVAALNQFADTSRLEAVDWFKYGKITWTSGVNVGLSMEVAAFSGGAMTLALPMPYTVAVGDAYSMVAGCNKIAKGNMARTGSITFPSSGSLIIYDSTRTETTNFYAGGSLVWTSGANNGSTANIIASIPGQIGLAAAPTNATAIGDGYTITPPASRLLTGDCIVKFNNYINFRGFPDVPGADLVLGLGGTEGTNL